MQIENTRAHKQFGGFTRFFRHFSQTCNHSMNFAVYLPPQAEHRKLPAVYFLSGLTCSEEIFMTEAQAQAYAKKYELILVVPDTSPRNTGIPGEDDSYDLGSGASFYVNATEAKWAPHYQMESYLTKELISIIEANFPVDSTRRGIFGHSMGGHGALTLGLKNPELYHSISAFAPICKPSETPWGIRAFTEYLGPKSARWLEYDADALLQKHPQHAPILIDQGLDDEYLESELSLSAFEATAAQSKSPVKIRRQAGYDHSYFFISTFVEDHLAFHAEHLRSRIDAVSVKRTD